MQQLPPILLLGQVRKKGAGWLRFFEFQLSKFLFLSLLRLLLSADMAPLNSNKESFSNMLSMTGVTATTWSRAGSTAAL